MANTLLDHLRSKFTSSAVQDLARILGENTALTQKVVDGLLPAVTAGVINQASTDEGAATLYNLLKTTPFDSDPTMEQLVETGSHRQRAAESGNDLLTRLYSDRPDRLAEATAQYSGINIGSAATLSGLVMSVLMGYLHKQVTTRNLSPALLAAFLRGEGDTTRQAVPAALAGLLGWFIGSGASRPLTTTTTTVPTETVTQVRSNDDRSGTLWWRWLLLALLLLALLFWLLRSCNRDKDETATTDGAATGSGAVVGSDTVASDTVGTSGGANGVGNSVTSGAGAAAGAAGSGDSATTNGATAANGPEVRVGVDLPGGRRLNVAENSFNYSLAKYLADKSRKPNRIFTFDNLKFETNSARITGESQTHVNDLIQIMQAYPSLQIRVEGHTDNTGNQATNKILSDDRAESVKAALVKTGIDAGRITTKGFSENEPVASNKTTEGRRENRRIDVAVTKF